MSNNQYPEIYTQFLANMLIIGFLIGFVILLTLLYQKRKMQQNREMELLKAKMEKELLTTRLEIQEDLQREVSMEIHDNIGQTMLLANVNLSILHNELNNDPSALTMLKETKELIIKSMEDLTNLSRNMNPDKIVETGVFNVIMNELNNLSKKKVFEVRITNNLQNHQLLKLKPDVQLILFRVYQEAIKNIIKHAEASEVMFDLTNSPKGILLTLQDNGIGFDYDQSLGAKGIGLKNLQKRVSIFNGVLTIDSVLGKGTKIQILIPSDKIIDQQS